MTTRRDAHKIVVADDSPLYRGLLRKTLAHEKYNVFIAKDGCEALALVAEHQPSVLITDWEMPDLSGIELCGRVHRENEFYTHIILLTSNDGKDQIVEGLAAGANDYLVKPFHAGELLARVGVGIRVAELQQEVQAKNRLLEELALTDALTQLPNRRALESWALHALRGAQRHKFPFWVVMGDLDHFKGINDTYSHEAGDCVLRRVASILQSHTRGSDICARLGGEEFVLGLSHAEKSGVEVAVERIRAQIQSEGVTWKEECLRVTASFGVAGLHDQIKDFNDLLREADLALYAAKQGGRNRVEFYLRNRPASGG